MNRRVCFTAAALTAAVFLSAASQPVRAEVSSPDAPGFYERTAKSVLPVAGSLADRGGEVPVLKEAAPVEVPAERVLGGPGGKIAIPDGAKAYLPNYMMKAAPGSLWPKDSTVVRERADELAAHFKRFYPDIVYHIDWDSDVVNAYAWKSGGERHVALKGGLLRHKALQIEGVALVLAHEIGHHYGGEPTYWNGLSCEGQADYWGAKVGMRTAYSEVYRENLVPAIEQLNAFFSKGVRLTITPAQEMRRYQDSKGCGHPPAACRKATYEAAMNDEPKPDCAGFAGDEYSARVALAPTEGVSGS